MVSFLAIILPHMIERKSGHIVVFSSVAGDRGKKRNLIYNASKSALSVYLEGIANKYYSQGVFVTDIKPGVTITPMTNNMKHGLLSTKADKVGRMASNAIRKKREVAYTPWFWKIIMTVICTIPHKIYKKLSL